MKSTIPEKPEPEKKLEYPYLGIKAQVNRIVLFEKSNTGIVVHAGFGPLPLGFHSDQLRELNDYKVFN